MLAQQNLVETQFIKSKKTISVNKIIKSYERKN